MKNGSVLYTKGLLTGKLPRKKFLVEVENGTFNHETNGNYGNGGNIYYSEVDKFQ
jgi:hypothetical protein